MYVFACRGGSLYTGISTDVARRYAAHQAGRGARYTRSHPPEKLLLTLAFPDRSQALKAEYSFKQLSAAEKRTFCMRHETVSD
jgi:putative endonuclease